MTSAGANKIIAKVETLVADAVKGLDFKSGDLGTTKSISGFPFILIKEIDGPKAESSGVERVAPWFPSPVGMYSEAGKDGSNVFVLPFDSRTLVAGTPCYSTPQPFLFIPKSQYQLVYLQQTFQVEAWEEDNFGPVVESVTAGPASVVAVAEDNIPESEYPGPLESFSSPGEYTYNFLLGRFYGVKDAPAVNLGVYTSNAPGNAQILAEDLVKNFEAQRMMSVSPLFFNANFPLFAAFNFRGASAGDVAAEGGYLANSYPAP